MTNQTFFTKITLIICAITIPVCFFLLTQILSWSYYWILLGFIFSIPNILSLLRVHYYRINFLSNLLALFLIVCVASVLLWQALLNGQRVDLSINLLILILALVIAATQQLLWLNYNSTTDKTSLHKIIEQALPTPPVINTFCIALIIADMCIAWLSVSDSAIVSQLAIKFLQRGIIPPITLTLFFWGLLLFVAKWLLMAKEMRNFSNNTSYLNSAYENNYHNSKETLGNMIWQQFEAFYALPRYINWAIPILGFIGTVLGISLATQNLGIILENSTSEVTQLLTSALTPLGIAFDTTLIALSLSIILALIQTLLYRWEERHLINLIEKLD